MVYLIDIYRKRNNIDVYLHYDKIR